MITVERFSNPFESNSLLNGLEVRPTADSAGARPVQPERLRRFPR